MQANQEATFECTDCGREFRDELPELLHVEAWPVCCGIDSYLIEIEEVEAGEGRTKSPGVVDTRLPLSGLDDHTPS